MEYQNVMTEENRVKVKTTTGPSSIKASFSIDDWKWFLDELKKIDPGKDFILRLKEGGRDIELRICNRDSGTKTL